MYSSDNNNLVLHIGNDNIISSYTLLTGADVALQLLINIALALRQAKEDTDTCRPCRWINTCTVNYYTSSAAVNFQSILGLPHLIGKYAPYP